MIWLSIATSSDPCSLALSDDQGLVAETVYRHRMRLSERLISDVDYLLQDAGVELGDVDAFAVDIGPGSFTGVRVGVTSAKTWADLFKKPLVGVSALEAISYGYRGVNLDLIVPTIRARPGAVYFAELDGETGNEELPAGMATFEDLLERLGTWTGRSVLICGDGWNPIEDQLRKAGDGADIALALKPAVPLRAGALAEIAGAKLLKGTESNSLDLVPLYIAPPPIGAKPVIGVQSSVTSNAP